jgi:nucleoside-diphosphate-sugar epimerase
MNKAKIKTVSILGCGWFGKPLARKLLESGLSVKGSTTNPEKLDDLQQMGIQAYLIHIAAVDTAVDIDFFNTDVLLIDIPPRRNTSEQHSFMQKIEQISQLAVQQQIKEILFISSTSVYGDHNLEVDESSAPDPDSASGAILLNAENYLKAQDQFHSTVIRFGGLIGPGRDPGRFLAGKTGIANGLAPVNLIHLTDCIEIVSKIILQDAFGYTFNATAPDHPTRQTFYTQAAKKSGLPEPQFISECRHWKIVNSTQAARLLDYSFQRPNWEDWI